MLEYWETCLGITRWKIYGAKNRLGKEIQVIFLLLATFKTFGWNYIYFESVVGGHITGSKFSSVKDECFENWNAINILNVMLTYGISFFKTPIFIFFPSWYPVGIFWVSWENFKKISVSLHTQERPQIASFIKNLAHTWFSSKYLGSTSCTPLFQ